MMATVGRRLNRLGALVARRRRLQLLLAMLLGFLLGVATITLFNAGAGAEHDRPAAVSDTLHHWSQDHDDD
jgi:hypothetical protein